MTKSVCGDWEQKESSTSSREMAAAQVDVDPEKKQVGRGKQMSPGKQTISAGTESGRTDGGIVSLEAEAPEKPGRVKPQPPREQMEVYPGSETTTGSR